MYDLSSSSLVTQQLREDCQGGLEDINDLLTILHSYLEHFTEMVMHLEDRACDVHISTPLFYTGRPGRPPFMISKSQIELLTELGYRYAKIATMFGVSERTLLRRREEYGLPVGQSYSNISDEELDTIVQSVYQVMTMNVHFCGLKRIMFN